MVPNVQTLVNVLLMQNVHELVMNCVVYVAETDVQQVVKKKNVGMEYSSHRYEMDHDKDVLKNVNGLDQIEILIVHEYVSFHSVEMELNRIQTLMVFTNSVIHEVDVKIVKVTL